VSVPVHALLTLIFRLEADRTEAICGLGRVPGCEDLLEEVDAQLGSALSALEKAGARYPLHMLAATSDLDENDYLLLQMSMLQRHGVDRVRRVTAGIGEVSDFLRLSHAVRLFGQHREDWERVADELRGLRVFGERIVELRPVAGDPADATLHPGPAVHELMGWDPDA
jgi:hypothetical protein